MGIRIKLFSALAAMLALAVAHGATAQTTLTGLIHHWPADGTPDDAAGTADGTMHDSVAFGTGVFGQAFQFAGGHVTLGSGTANFGTSDFTISMWVWTQMSVETALMSKRENCVNVPMIDIRKQPAGTVTVEFQGVSNDYTAFATTSAIADGAWHHLAWSRVGTLQQGYIDGNFAGAASGPAPIEFANNAQLMLGRSPCTGGPDGTQPFVGFLDDIQIYNRALTSAEICELAGEVLCPADIAHNCHVDVDDLLAVINAWGPCSRCVADITSNGQVDVDDLLAVINAWGNCA